MHAFFIRITVKTFDTPLPLLHFCLYSSLLVLKVFHVPGVQIAAPLQYFELEVMPISVSLCPLIILAPVLPYFVGPHSPNLILILGDVFFGIFIVPSPAHHSGEGAQTPNTFAKLSS